MVMPPCGTFAYSLTLPRGWRDVRRLRMRDVSGAPRFAFGRRLFTNRLVGHRPFLTAEGDQVILLAARFDHAEIENFSLSIDRRLIQTWQPCDDLYLVRTATADLGVSIVRGNRLLAAVGAITQLELGPDIRVSSVTTASCPDCDTVVAADGKHCHKCGASLPNGLPSAVHPFDSFKRPEHLLDLSVRDNTRRFGGGGHGELDGYEITVLHGFCVGIPGTFECVAISDSEACLHEVAVASAALLKGISLDQPPYSGDDLAV